jgi:hypothetical protein
MALRSKGTGCELNFPQQDYDGVLPLLAQRSQVRRGCPGPPGPCLCCRRQRDPACCLLRTACCPLPAACCPLPAPCYLLLQLCPCLGC